MAASLRKGGGGGGQGGPAEEAGCEAARGGSPAAAGRGRWARHWAGACIQLPKMKMVEETGKVAGLVRRWVVGGVARRRGRRGQHPSRAGLRWR